MENKNVKYTQIKNSFLHIFDKKGNPLFVGLVKLNKKDKNRKHNERIFFINENKLLLQFNENKIIQNVYLLKKKKFEIKNKNGKKIKVIEKEYKFKVYFYINKYWTLVHKKYISKRKKSMKISNNFYNLLKNKYKVELLIKRKDGEFFSINIIDCLFFGMKKHITINNKIFNSEFFYINKIGIIRKLVFDNTFYTNCIKLINEISSARISKIIMKNSILFNFLIKVLQKVKIYRRRKIKKLKKL